MERTCKIGIDFGTTYSTLSAYVDDKLVAFELEGSPYIPTFISICDSDKILIGESAKCAENIYANYCKYYDLKRWVGVNEERFEGMKRKINPEYNVKFENGDCLMEGIGNNKRFTGVKTLISWYLKVLIELFESKYLIKVNLVNVSVPAEYLTVQRTYMRVILDNLGVKVDRIVNEPSAAAINKIFEAESVTNVLVFDFGGGTFDSSLIAKKGKTCMIIDTLGDLFLGGRDIDNSINKYIKDKYGIELEVEIVENIKLKTNSKNFSHHLVIDKNGRRSEIEFGYNMLEKIVQPYAQRALKNVEQIIDRNGITSCLISMVGGSSLLKPVQNLINNYATTRGFRVSCTDDLRLAVSYGCTILHRLCDDNSCTFIDVNSHPIFEPRSFFMHKIILRKPMPIPMTIRLDQTYRNDFLTALNVIEGDDPFILNDNLLIEEEFRTSKLSELNKKLYFVYDYNKDGMLSVRVEDENQNVLKEFKTNISNVMQRIELDKIRVQQSDSSGVITLLNLLKLRGEELKGLPNLYNDLDCHNYAEKLGGYEKLLERI